MVNDDTKTINGKRYAFLYYRNTKAKAQQDAKNERASGWNIRIVKNKIRKQTYYDLYGRRR